MGSGFEFVEEGGWNFLHDEEASDENGEGQEEILPPGDEDFQIDEEELEMVGNVFLFSGG